ncbi:MULTISPECIES: potassium-transporting ATPase subunit KdpC [unclassified Modestobacter]|uniref:potassium-transporting ATPase subunit KdpC n=1 Tax=unclassified Modestobacter TaxID=2643866 RepID=UPI0022AA08A2|nr:MULTISPECIES: potassium-transporting ATPase subunit KdpC [unclassified Modestobacter]MCZ2824295.1 potassium-transporting ATPase subunit KdpC [Modestobacter sp. VKM Ac-2981]MCZ2854177.1 potassium-transporting ATPase subunit KdpC [Modestobacter sp. VKM Ac-2982]
MSALRSGRQLVAAVRALLVATVVLGLAYPLLMTGVAQVIAPARADGSLVSVEGSVVGSSLIGQSFTGADGDPLQEYFQTRPSASDYDGAASGGSNLGPNSEELVAAVGERRAAVAALNGVAVDEVPADAVTASGSGLDPDISPEYAALQVVRVAEARGVSMDDVQALVDEYTDGRDLGFIGAPHVRVLELNLALHERFGAEG